MTRTTLSAWLRSGPGSKLGIRSSNPRAACNSVYQQLFQARVNVVRLGPNRLQVDGCREVVFLSPQEPAIGLSLVHDPGPSEAGR